MGKYRSFLQFLYLFTFYSLLSLLLFVLVRANNEADWPGEGMEKEQRRNPIATADFTNLHLKFKVGMRFAADLPCLLFAHLHQTTSDEDARMSFLKPPIVMEISKETPSDKPVTESQDLA